MQSLEMKALQGGYFVEHVQDKHILHKNTLVQYGAQSMLEAVFQGATPFAATWYLGLTNVSYTFDEAALLAALHAGEPAGHGYARIAINQDNVDWTISEVNGVMQTLSKICTFTASSDWDKQWLRMFLCDAVSGTSGNVISVSGPAPASRTVLNGAGPSMQYAYYLRG